MNKYYNILITEDETMSSIYLNQILTSLGYTNIFISTNAQDALKITSTTHIDFAFVDINIEGAIDGIKCAHLLNEINSIPIIFTTAYSDSRTMEEASETNMFGYLIKPFEAQDVQASIYTLESRLRTKENLQEKQEKKLNTKPVSIELEHDYHFNFSSKTLLRDKIPINLTKKEMEILYILCTNINQNVSYELLQEKVWENKDIANATLRDTIRRLRAKSEKLNIQSVSGYGYILVK